jgi:hypothetical protein
VVIEELEKQGSKSCKSNYYQAVKIKRCKKRETQLTRAKVRRNLRKK